MGFNFSPKLRLLSPIANLHRSIHFIFATNMNQNNLLHPESSINFFNQDISYVLRDKRKVVLWLLKCASAEQLMIGELNYIFSSDNYLLKLNKKHLQHNFLTDIITFPLQTGGITNADIYISVDRVKENAKSFGVSFKDEMHRVMIHGMLHLCGYKDKTETEVKKMRAMENKWLAKRW